MTDINTTSTYIKLPTTIFLTLVLLIIGGVFYLVGDLLINGDDRNIFLIANLLTILPFFAYYYYSKSIFLFNPINFIFPSILLGTTLRGIYIYLGVGHNDYIDQTLLLGKHYSILFSGSFINLIGAWLILFGFLMVKDKKISIKNAPKIFEVTIWSQKRFKLIISILVAISIGAFIIYLGKINFSFEKLSVKRHMVIESDDEKVFASFGYLTLFVKFGEIALHLFAIWYYSHTRKLKLNLFLIFAVLFLIAHIPNFIDSSRSSIIYSITFILITRLIFREGKFEIKKMIPLVGIIIFVIISMGSLREIYNYKEEDASSRLSEDFDIVNVLEKVVGNRNMLGISKASHIYEAWNNDGEYSYLGGSSLVTWIFAPIPRSVWIDKPQTSLGLTIKGVFGASDAVARGGVPPGFPTELYMNFGFLGVFLIIFYGIFLRWLHIFMRTYCNKNTVYLYFIVLMHMAFGLIGNNLSKSIADLMIDAIPLIIILNLIIVSKKNLKLIP